MKIIIIGLPYFGNKLAKRLKEYDSKNKYMYLNTNSSRLDKLVYLFQIIFAKKLYVISGDICCSNTINIALFLRKKVLIHWVGSDVLKAKKKIGTPDYINNEMISHVAIAPWLIEELNKDIGLKAKLAPMMTYDKKIDIERIKLPESFSIFSYIGKNKEIFYGIDTIIKLAKDFPNIKFRIAGIDAYNEVDLKNVKFLGWINDIEEEYLNNIAYLRAPEHDVVCHLPS